MTGSRSRALPWFAAAVSGLALAQLAQVASAGEPAPAARGLVEAMEADALTVVGRINEVQRLDAHGYSARIWVERVVGARAGDFDEGTPLRFAWEELASGRPPRFDESGRALVVLEPLGSASIWRTRIPEPSKRRQTLGLALGGSAFVHDPALGSIDVLHHYLAIAPEARDGAAGVRFLATLVATAQPALAVAAADRLSSVEGLSSVLGPDSEQALVRGLLREHGEPALVDALLPVFDAVHTDSLAGRLRDAASAATDGGAGGRAPARVFDALSRVSPTGITSDDRAWLVAQDDPAYRQVAVRTATAGDAALLRRLAVDDPDPLLRAAALEQLVAVLGMASLPDTLASLADAVPAVRGTAARLAASFGDRAVPDLRAIVYGRYPACCATSRDARHAAISGLSLAGPGGRRALAEIGRDHPDPALRKLADLARGDLDTHAH